MDEVRVVNRNKFPLRGRFAGQDYVFEPGKGTHLSMEAVRHIFAFGSENKAGALNKLGLLFPGGTLEKAMEAYNKITFYEGRMVFQQETPKSPQPQPPRDPGAGEPGVEEPPEPESEGEEEEEDKEIGASSDAPVRAFSPDGKSEADENPTPSLASGDLMNAILSARRPTLKLPHK